MRGLFEHDPRPAELPMWAKSTTVYDIIRPMPIIIYLDNPFDAMPTERLTTPVERGLNILACGAGMQSTALALMSAENAIKGYPVHPLVPVYDAVLFCDLGFEALS